MEVKKPAMPEWTAPKTAPAGKFANTPNKENFASVEFANLAALIVIFAMIGLCSVLAFRVLGG